MPQVFKYMTNCFTQIASLLLQLELIHLIENLGGAVVPCRGPGQLGPDRREGARTSSCQRGRQHVQRGGVQVMFGKLRTSVGII